MPSSHRLLIPVAALMLAAACGDDEQGPTGPGEEPAASTLSADASGSANTVFLSWTQCPDSDFEQYRLFRSTTPDIEESPAGAVIVATHSTASDTVFTDTGLDWDETYYYALVTRDTEGLETWSNEVSAVTPDSGASGDWLTCAEIQGGAASSPYEGEIVTVMGLVTVGGDEFYTQDSPYAVITDPLGGAWSGLVLYGDSVGSLARGDSVLVTGTVQEYYELTEIGFITGVEILGTGADLPAPSQVYTFDLSASGSPEQWEAVLVEVSDAVVESVGSYGQFDVDDGSGACIVDDLGDYGYTPVVGDTLFSAAGVLWYSYDEWKLEPRDDGDLDVGGGSGPGDVLTCYEVQGQQASSPYLGQVVSVTGIVTVGGGEFYSSSQEYAVIQDAGGAEWSGLILFDSDIAAFVRGDSVTVTGTVQEYYGLTEISYITMAQVHSGGHALPSPQTLSTGALSTSAVPEEWEGVLVMIQDLTVVSDSLGFGEWSVTDGSGTCRIDDLGEYTYEPAVGGLIQSITGVCWYSFDDFKVEPRDDADIDV